VLQQADLYSQVSTGGSEGVIRDLEGASGDGKSYNLIREVVNLLKKGNDSQLNQPVVESCAVDEGVEICSREGTCSMGELSMLW
jgi:hypothetical protein